MDCYIGTKIVLAEPMVKGQAVANGWARSEVAMNPEEPGYKVVYDDGYTSWSPKAVFERCYRQLTDAEIRLIPHGGA
jgi:hypothetical protein